MRRNWECLLGRKYFLERPTSTLVITVILQYITVIFKVHTACWQEQKILEAGLHEQI